MANRNGTPYTAADDLALSISLNRADCIFVIKLGKDTTGASFTCAICLLEFFYFTSEVVDF